MKKKFMALLLSVAAVFAFAACGADPVATVNGEKISQDAYREYVNYTMSMYGLSSGFNMTSDMGEMLKTQAIESLVYMEEVKQAAEEVGCAPSDDELTEYIYSALGVTDKSGYTQAISTIKTQYGLGEDMLKDILGVQLYSEKLGEYLGEEQGIKVSKKAAVKAYNEAPENYDNRTVSHILVTPEVADGRTAETDENGSTIYTDEEWAAAEAKAKDLIAQLDDGADFAELAKENSDDTASAANGGALDGSFTRADSSYVEEFTTASFALTEKGQYTEEPVKSTYGYHIILCTGIQDKDHDYDKLIKSIRKDLLAEKQQEAFNAYMDEYKEKADVVINYGNNKTDAKKTEDDAAAEDTTDTTETTDNSSDSTDNADNTEEAGDEAAADAENNE